MSTYMIIISWVVLLMMTLALFSKSNNTKESNEKINSASDEQISLLISSYKFAGFMFIIMMGSFWIGSGLTVSNLWLQLFIAFNFTYMIHKLIRNLNNLKLRKVKHYMFDKFLAGINYIFVVWFIATYIVFNH